MSKVGIAIGGGKAFGVPAVFLIGVLLLAVFGALQLKQRIIM